jgi:putative ATP-dependent endonuclease of OLD family
LLGENNAGKSNVLRALSLVLGEVWPGSHQPEDHEFYDRSREGVEMRIHLEVEGLMCPKGCDSTVERIIWKFCDDDERPCDFWYEADCCTHKYMSNELRGQLTCMTVGADRDLAYQLSYSSKWTTLSKLMRRFHQRLVADPGRVERLKGAFEEVVATFSDVAEYAEFSQLLRTATEDFGGNLPYGLDIDFSAYDASNFFRSLRIFPHLDGEARSYEELGTGQQQILAIAFTYAYARTFGGEGLVLAFEEPEAHLHPLAQEWVASRLLDLGSSGVQVLLTTHSPYFVSLASPGSAVLVRKRNRSAPTSVVQLRAKELSESLIAKGAPPEKVTAVSVGPFYENSATTDIKAGLFARACVFVEGATEQYGLTELLRRIGFDVTKAGVALVPVDGITNLPKWLRYFDCHAIPVYAIFDTDSTKTGSGAEQARTARADIFRALGVAANDWADVTTGPFGVTDSFAVCDPDYEIAIRALFGDEYEALEATARELFGSAKPLVARYAARNLADPLPDQPGWKAAKTLRDALRARFAAVLESV